MCGFYFKWCQAYYVYPTIPQPFGPAVPAGIRKLRALIEMILLWSVAYMPYPTTANPNGGDKHRFVFSPHWGWYESYKTRASGGKIKLWRALKYEKPCIIE